MILREVIRGILREEDLPAKKSQTAVYKDIEAQQDIFKFNGARLTLVDKKSRPFSGMTDEEVEAQIVDFINRAGYRVNSVVKPGQSANGKTFSSKFNTYVVFPEEQESMPEEDQQKYYITFGYSYSGAESIQFDSLHDEIARLVKDSGGKPILVWNGSEYIEVDDAIRVGGSGDKADVVLTREGEPVIKISLKNLANGKVADMQQWGGMLPFVDHPEVQQYIKDVQVDLQKDEGNRMWRPIADDDLKRRAMWSEGSSEVDVIIAGVDPKLMPDDSGGYRLEVGIGPGGAGGVWHRSAGESPDDGFEPVLFSRPAKDRSLGPLKGIRGMIMPIGTITKATREI